MDRKELDTQKISRKDFLQVAGSILAGGTILGSTAYLISNRNEQVNFLESKDLTVENNASTSPFQSPYKLVESFSTPDTIDGLELYNDKIVVATPNTLSIYDTQGGLLNNFAIGSNLRDMAVENDLIYLLFASRIEVYHFSSQLKQAWDACSDTADYCSIAVSPYHVFVTDVANKNICQYTTDGNLERFIESPNRFIIPSYTFCITYANNSIYCSNPGRHSVERYTVKGQYLGAFGTHGDAPGSFCGCCNPVHLDYTSEGDIITSEKGNPRISCYDEEGNFRNLLLNTEQLGGGNTAYRVKVDRDKIVVAGNSMVSTFQYDKELASNSGCVTCNKNCPLREGISI